LLLRGIRWICDSKQLRREPSGSCPLLDDVGELVRYEPAARSVSRPELPVAEDHIAADGVRAGADGSRGARGHGASVHAHVAEVVPEARFHRPTHRRGKLLAGLAQHLAHRWRYADCGTPRPRADRLPLHRRLVVIAPASGTLSAAAPL
jgi:hypothetical protein